MRLLLACRSPAVSGTPRRSRTFRRLPLLALAVGAGVLPSLPAQASPPTGWSLALVVDGGTSSIGSSIATTDSMAAVGAPFAPATSGGSPTGAVFVYTHAGGGWTGEPITAPVPLDGGNFGTSLAASGNLLAVGAAGTPPAAYVFAGDGGTYQHAQTWADPASDKNASFGSSVALFSGGAGVSYVAISAPPGSASANGIVYVARRSAGGAWSASLVPLTDPAAAAFGIAIAFAGNGQLLVGDPGTGPGQVLVYSPETDGGWESAGTLPASFGTGGLQQLGNAIATWEGRAVVAAPGTTGDAGTSNGAVLVFSVDDAGVWSQEAILTAPAAESFANFIPAIADGLIAVGTAINSASSGAGGVDLWALTAGAWVPITPGALGGDAYYGQAVGISGGSLFIGDTSAAGASSISDVSSSLFVETPEYDDGGDPSDATAVAIDGSVAPPGEGGAPVSDGSANGLDASTVDDASAGGPQAGSSSSGCSCTSAGMDRGGGLLALALEGALGVALWSRRRRPPAG